MSDTNCKLSSQKACHSLLDKLTYVHQLDGDYGIVFVEEYCKAVFLRLANRFFRMLEPNVKISLSAIIQSHNSSRKFNLVSIFDATEDFLKIDV